MATIAPWIIPPNYPAIMQAGVQSGLALRRQQESEADSAERLRLAYDQLEASNRRAEQEARLKSELAKASLALRGQQMEGLQSYRLGQLNARDAAQKLREENMARLGEQFQQREARQSEQFDETTKRLLDAHKDLEAFRRSLPGKLDPNSYALQSADKAELIAIERKLNSMEPSGWVSEAIGHGNKREIERLTNRAEELRARIAAYPVSKPERPSRLVWDAQAGILRDTTE